MKNKRLLWILVMLILVVSSVAVEAGIMDGIRGVTSKLGGLTGWGIVAVNAAIIAAVLYFGLSLVPKFAPKESKTGRVVFAVIIILFAIMFAVHIRNSIGDKFIWSSDAFKGGFNYLFKGEYTNKDGETVYGILNPANLWKFIGMALIISWLFITFLKVGQNKQTIDIALAVIISANAVHGGLEPISVIHLGQAIAILILTVQFSKTFEGLPGGKWVKWITAIAVAGILVGWISSIVFPNTPFLWGGEKKTVTEIAKEAKEGWSWGKVVILVFALILAASTSGVTGELIKSLSEKMKGLRGRGTSEDVSREPTGKQKSKEEVVVENGRI